MDERLQSSLSVDESLTIFGLVVFQWMKALGASKVSFFKFCRKVQIKLIKALLTGNGVYIKMGRVHKNPDNG